MVPVESTAFALLAVCMILLAAVLFVGLVPLRARETPARSRPVLLLILAVVVVLSIYVLVTTTLR